jgi:hypothetical protein
VIEVPRELLWDVGEAPDDDAWRLQRVAEWFPAFGRDRATVRELYRHRARLLVPAEIRASIELYERAWRLRRGEDAC